MNRRRFLTTSAAMAAGVALESRLAPATFAQHNALPASKPATTTTASSPADVQWHDPREWGVEGRAFDDTLAYYDRLPGRAKGVVRDAVWDLSRNTASMSVRFQTDASAIFVRYALTDSRLAMAHMPATGVSGVDLYARDPQLTADAWRWVATHLPKSQTVETQLVGSLPASTRDGRAYLLNLPLYNGVSSLEIGVPHGATFIGTPPRDTPAILFYGTSITQGGCASRPGLAFVNLLGRRLDRPVLNFGFSGNGQTEVEVAHYLAELSPAVFVLDCMANMTPEQIHDRTFMVVNLWRRARPTTPILLLEVRTWASGPLAPGILSTSQRKRAELKRAFDTLTAGGVANLHYHGGDDLIGSDGEGTVDGSHPNDLGMMRYADALEPVLKQLIR